MGSRLLGQSTTYLIHEVREEGCAQNRGGQLATKDDYVSDVDGRECDVGMDRTPLGTSGSKGVLSPINIEHSKHIKFNSGMNDQFTPKDEHDSDVDGRECDVGMDRTPLGTLGSKGVLSPINRQHSKHIKYNSKLGTRGLPSHCLWFKSKVGVSSRRTRAAAGAFMKWCSSRLWGRDRVRNRIKTLCKKHRKQRETLMLIEEDDDLVKLSMKFSVAYLRKNTVVFDGGDVGEEPLQNVAKTSNWESIRISDGGLKVFAPPNPGMGCMYKQVGDEEPRFILIPRAEALKLNKDGRHLCRALRRVMKRQNNLKRGKSKTIF